MAATLDRFASPAQREGLLLDADYVTLPGGSAAVRLWVREGAKAIALLDPRFEPYFYALPSTEDARLDLLVQRAQGVFPRPRRVEAVERGDGLRKVPALKVTAYHPQDVPRLREAVQRVEGVKEVREADIPFAFRYLIDHKLRPMGGIAWRSGPHEAVPGAEVVERVEARDAPGLDEEAKVLAFDLEVHNPYIVPRPREDPILLISVATNHGLLEVLANEGRDLEGWKRGDKDLMQSFLDLLRREDPDIIVTYNGDEFDWPYLLERARHHRLRLDVGRDGAEPQVRQAGQHRVVSLTGRQNVDLLRIAQRDLGDVKVKTLKNVADFLGVVELKDRVTVAKERIHELWADPAQRPTLVAYARDDARATLGLAAKLLPLQAELARMTRMPLDEESKMGRGRQVDWFLIAEAHERGLLAPNKTFIRDEVYEGGLVLDPPTGLHEDIVALDFGSMYPSIMVSYNVSPETHLPAEVAGAFKPEEISVAPEVGHKFLRSPQGFFPAILQDLVTKRRAWKKLLKGTAPGSSEHTVADVKQQTLKILTNCFSGDTEVLTPKGPVNIRDVKVGDMVHSINPATMDVEVKVVLEAFSRPYAGDMVRLRTADIDLLVTPNHRMLVSTYEAPQAYRFVEAGQLRPMQRYYMPTGRAMEGKRVETFELPGLWGAEITRVPEAMAVLAAIQREPGLRRQDLAARMGLTYAGAQRHTQRLIAAGLVRDTRAARRQGGPGGHSQLFAGEGPAAALAPGPTLQAGPRHGRIPRTYAMDDWLQFMAWYVSEGSIYVQRRKEYVNGNVRGVARRIQLAQKTPEFRGEITALLTRMGLPHQMDRNGAQMSNTLLRDWLEQNCGKGSANKTFPEWVLGLDVAQRQRFLDTLMKGDGNKAYKRYTTISRALRDRFARLALELGYKVKLREDSGCYRVWFFPNRGSFRPHRSVARVPNTEGLVHCVTVADNHTVCAGRNGTFQWVGQSFYGYTGWAGARWYKRECAEATTAWGRTLVKQVVEEARKRGLEVLYGDTDSCFLKSSPKIRAFVDDMNARLPLELEVQAHYDVIFFTGAKKRYAGLTKEGKVVVRGLEVRRGDWCELAKELQEEVLEQVLRRRDPKAALKAAQEAVRRVRGGKAGLEELTIFKTLTMDPEDYKAKQAHVHAVEKAQRLQPDYQPQQGTKIGYVILKAKGALKDVLPSERAVLVEFLKPGEELDTEYYVEKQLMPAALRILEYFGVSEAEVKGQPKQQSLKDWF